MSWIQTYTNRKFYPLNPQFADIVVEDIAHALSNLCRFTGHVAEFYSVAEHSCHVSDLLPAPLKLWGLLHDASEAYLADIARPVKQLHHFRGYLDIERDLMAAITLRFGLPVAMPDEVKRADDALLQCEALQLMGSLTTEWVRPELAPETVLPCWNPKEAKAEFLRRFHSLTTVRVESPDMGFDEAVAAWKEKEAA